MAPINLLSRLAVAFLLILSFTGTFSAAGPVEFIQVALGNSTKATTTLNQCPETETIVEYLKENTNIGPNTVFYTSPISAAQAGAIAKQLTPPGNFYSNLITSEMQLQWLEECGPGPEQDKLVPRISEAIALASSDIAYLVIEEGTEPKDTSIWVKYEFPALKRNDRITEVKKVIYGDGQGQGLENAEVIWTTGSFIFDGEN